ncbi:MAG: NAD(P)H-binding protein [Xanthomonadales bacterium]|jgi:nucleoside-diphosphate-sugar epimerase|nr:NAD(P)H-binding protein [Xanthomonadales bacterium]
MNAAAIVTVSGASSQLGVFLLPRLQNAGFAVRAVSRSAPAEGLEIEEGISWVGPLLELELAAGRAPADFLVSCGPLSLARKLLRQHKPFSSAVVFSTSSILTKPDSADPGERDLVNAIAKEEGQVKAICRERGIPLVLIRPTMIYGCGLDRNVSMLYRLGARTGFIPLSSQAGGRRQPVHADDLAALAVEALSSRVDGCLEGEACGGETLEFREVARRVAACAEGRVRPLPLPAALLTTVVKIFSSIRPGTSINTEMVRRQAVNMVFDDTVFRQSLAYQPRPFNPTPADFSIPPKLERFRLKL